MVFFVILLIATLMISAQEILNVSVKRIQIKVAINCSNFN